MIAKLVDFQFTTRVVLPSTATQEEFTNAAINNLRDRLLYDKDGELAQAAGDPMEDSEQPYDPEFDTTGKFGIYDSPPVAANG
jgi:hypothetical protein